MLVVDELKAAIETNLERHKIYGDSSKKIAAIMVVLFPSGFALKTAHDWELFFFIQTVVAKLSRFAHSVTAGEPHHDSVHDMGVYSFLLEKVIKDAIVHPEPAPVPIQSQRLKVACDFKSFGGFRCILSPGHTGNHLGEDGKLVLLLCQSKTWDRASCNDVSCKLEAGHEGRHYSNPPDAFWGDCEKIEGIAGKGFGHKCKLAEGHKGPCEFSEAISKCTLAPTD